MLASFRPLLLAAEHASELLVDLGRDLLAVGVEEGDEPLDIVVGGQVGLVASENPCVFVHDGTTLASDVS